MQRVWAFFVGVCLAALSSSVSAQTCVIPVGGFCGTAQGALCCPEASFCQPWNADYYQCLAVPEGCGSFETDVEFVGGDLAAANMLVPTDCCARCKETAGCVAFTFVNLDPLGPRCYMKSADFVRARKVGSVSALRIGGAVTPAPTLPPATCTNPVGNYCGNAGGMSACCPTSSYCMPWDKYYYQCLAAPEGCGMYETDIDYYGNDVDSIANIQPWECCTKCKENTACKYFSFVNSNPGVPPTCYLKSSNAGRVRSVGVLSGSKLSSIPAPTPVPPTTPVPLSPITSTPAASQCVKHLKNIWYHGNDISEVVLADPELCCAECAKTKGCVLYSLMINSSTGLKRCVLKSAASNDKTNYGDSKTITAYSGFVINPML